MEESGMKQLKIGDDVKLVFDYWPYGDVHEVTLEYVEHATDYWSQDQDTSVYLDKDKAIEIVNFLKEVYELQEEDLKC
jgi:hypothetical protein